MQKITRIKKTGQVVDVVGDGDRGYKLCLFRFNRPTKDGRRAAVQAVKEENLQHSSEL